MGDIQNSEKKNKRPVLRYMMYILLVVSLVAGVAFSRYVTELSGNDSARAAQFDYAISVERNAADELTAPFDGYTDYWAFDGGDGLNTSIAGGRNTTAEFDVALYATTKLSDPDAGNFDSTARVIDVTVTNNSEVAVRTLIKNLMEIPKIDSTDTDNQGIVWCLFDGAYSGYDDIWAKLQAQGYTPADDYNSLIEELNIANEKTLAAWNNDAVMAPGASEKTLTIVIWAEHSAVLDDGWNFDGSSPLNQTIDINYTVTQVD